MPVISARRSSATTTAPSTSSNLYGTTSANTTSSLLGSSSLYSSSTSASKYDRASSLSKTLPSSSSSSTASSNKYSSSYSYLNSGYSPLSSTTTGSSLGTSSSSSYTPRSSAYRSSSSSSNYLSGGSSSLSSSYRSPSSYLSSYDSISASRYGLPKKSSKDEESSYKKKDYKLKPPSGHNSDFHVGNISNHNIHNISSSTLNLNNNNNNSNECLNNNNNNKRLTTSSSTSSLAKLVATSGLDLYEKYSPAHYKPNCEISCSRSGVNEASSSLATNSNSLLNNDEIKIPSSRYSSSSLATTTNSSNNSNNSYATTNNHTTNTNSSSPTTTATPKLVKKSERVTRRSTSKSSVDGSGAAKDVVDNVSKYRTSSKDRLSTKSATLSTSESGSDIPTATFTLRSNRLKKKSSVSGAETGTSVSPSASSTLLATASTTLNHSDSYKNGDTHLGDTESKLKDLRLNRSSEKDLAADKHVNITIKDNGVNQDDNEISTSVNIKLDTLNSNESKIRDSVRSTLPPSPTTSKYWDRDTTRYSALSSYDTDTKTASYNEKREGLCGLRNIGNTCFMNSVIQCLSHTSDLTRFLRNYTSIRTSTKDQLILHEFSKLIREMWSGNTNSVTPSELKRSFSAKHRMYSDYNQQDAQEFLRFFLDSLHSALNTGVKGEHLRIDDSLSDNAKAEATWEWYTRIENSLIRDLFVGQLKSTLRCTTCGNTSVTFDPFWDLSVSLPTSSRCKLDACLDLFIREEILDGDEMPTCAKCKTRRKCTKSFSIQRFPKYLVIHLKRFSEARWSKLTNIVEFPTGERELNMGPYGSNSNSNIHYSLYAVSNHMGSTAGGHYVAVCKHPVSKKWHEFNDNIVSGSVPESQIVSSSAYILFYERS